jgi:hypothetical protein
MTFTTGVGFTINPCASPVIGISNLPSVVVGTSYNVSLDITGTPTPTVTVTGLPDGLTYSGGVISGTPTTPGYYTVTVTASNPGGTVTQTFELIVSTTPSPPPVINYRVTIVAADGFTTNPSGTAYVSIGNDFSLTITPASDDLVPAVTTSRGAYDKPSLTKNADGTYTAIVSKVYQQISIYINVYDPATGNAVVDDAIRVWGFGGSLHIVCRDAAATVNVYNLTGTLVATRKLQEIETVIPLPRGLYIVKVGDVMQKVLVQ